MTLQKFDDFAPDFAEVRKAVVEGKFSTERGPDGALYTGISEYPVPQWVERLSQLLKCKITPKLSCFRLNLEGELPHSWVHSDDICAQYASVLYMNEPEQCKGGTAFWKHKGLGVDRLMPKAALTSMGLDADCFYKVVEREWKEKESWEQVDFMPMKSNRFITYPTSLFHSRYPFEAFGKGPQDGRLIWICFYDKGETL